MLASSSLKNVEDLSSSSSSSSNSEASANDSTHFLVWDLLTPFFASLDFAIAVLWDFVCQFKVVANDSFEPFVAVCSFFVFINFFRFVDAYCVSWHRFRIQSLAGSSPDIEKIYRFDKTCHGLWALVGYLTPILLFDSFGKRRTLNRIPPTATRLLLELTLGVFLYDLLFYFPHLLMHKSRLMASIHRRHHSAHPNAASLVVKNSFVDGSLQVLANVLALKFVGSHSMTRILHNVLVPYLLTEIHSGYDFPFALHRLVPFNILGGPVYHSVHHSRGDVHFHQFFTYLDCLFGYTVAAAHENNRNSNKTKLNIEPTCSCINKLTEMSIERRKQTDR